jgi:hypothetical protein
LTGKPADQKINGRGMVERSDVFVDWNAGPVSCEDAALPRIQLALPRDAEPGPLKAEVSAADAREGTADGEHQAASVVYV